MENYWNKVAEVTSADPHETAEQLRDCFNGEDARVVSDETRGSVFIEQCYDDVDYGYYEVATDETEHPNPGEALSNLVNEHSTLEDEGYRMVFDYTNNRYSIEEYEEE